MSEIDEFLKRAAAMRARQQSAQPSPPAAGRQPPPPPTGSQRPALRRMPQDEIVLDAEVVQADAVSGDQIANYVSRHLDTGLFRERSSHLGEAVKSTDEAIESHLHATFEHRLGQLGGTTSRAEDSSLDEDENVASAAALAVLRRTDTATMDFQALIRSPQNLRNAIILAEILNPPRDRW